MQTTTKQRLEFDDPEVLSAKKVCAVLDICKCEDGKICHPCQIVASGLRGMGAAAFNSGMLKGAINQTEQIAELLNSNKAKNKKVKLVRPYLMRMLGKLQEKWNTGGYYELRQEDRETLRRSSVGGNQAGDSGRIESDERSTREGTSRGTGRVAPTGHAKHSEGSDTKPSASNDGARDSDGNADGPE